MSTPVPTPEEIRGWPATVDVPTAGSAFGVGRGESYRMAREGRFRYRYCASVAGSA